MDLPMRLTGALESLETALDRLERAAQRRLEAAGASDAELVRLRRDTASLRVAQEHDAVSVRMLLGANDEVGARLSRVADALRDTAGRGPPSDDPSG